MDRPPSQTGRGAWGVGRRASASGDVAFRLSMKRILRLTQRVSRWPRRLKLRVRRALFVVNRVKSEPDFGSDEAAVTNRRLREVGMNGLPRLP